MKTQSEMSKAKIQKEEAIMALRDAEGFDFKAIGIKLGISAAHARQIYQNGKFRLKQEAGRSGSPFCRISTRARNVLNNFCSERGELDSMTKDQAIKFFIGLYEEGRLDPRELCCARNWGWRSFDEVVEALGIEDPSNRQKAICPHCGLPIGKSFTPSPSHARASS